MVDYRQVRVSTPYGEIPQDAFQRLEIIQARIVVGVKGELWSPDKLLRRAVWHKRDHTQHIHKLLSMNEQQTQSKE